MTVTGDYDGHKIVLFASMLSGLETITVDGREVSRKRSFGTSTTHDLSDSGLPLDAAVVKVLPLRIELQKGGRTVATLTHAFGLWLPLLWMLAGLLMGAGLYVLGRVAGRFGE